MVNFLSSMLYGIGGLVCTCLVLLVTFQEKLVYVPVIPGMSKGYPITPARLGLKFEDVWLTSSDGVRLHSWLIKHHSQCTGPTMLFFQENAGNIAHRLEYVDILVRRLKCNVFMLSYRGYGASDGYPTQWGIMRDAQAALDHLLERRDIDPTKVVVFGRSLGGAVGSALVKSNPGKVCALILENTFTSVLDMVGIMFPFLKLLFGSKHNKGFKVLNWLVRSPWSTVEIIHEISEPILFISGAQDEMVPPLHMKQLYNASRSNPRCLFVEFPTGMHMDTWLTGGERYWRVLELFLKKHACCPETDMKDSMIEDVVDFDDSTISNSDSG